MFLDIHHQESEYNWQDSLLLPQNSLWLSLLLCLFLSFLSYKKKQFGKIYGKKTHVLPSRIELENDKYAATNPSGAAL